MLSALVPEAKSKNTKYYIHSAISIAIMAIFHFLPAPYPLTSGGMIVTGALLGAIYGWYHGNMFWSSILALMAIGISDVSTVSRVLAPTFSHTNVIFLIFFFTFVGYLNSIGFAQTLARKIVSSKLTKGRPWTLSLFLMIAAVLPASIMSVGAIAVVSLTLLHSICDELGIEKNSKWAVHMAVAIAACIPMAFTLWPFMVSPMTITGMWSGLGADVSLPFVQYVLFQFGVKIPVMLGMWAVLRFVFKPDVSKLYAYEPPAEKPKFDEKQMFALKLFILLIFLLLAPTIFPDGTAVHTFFAQFGFHAAMAIVLMCGTLLRDKEGKARVDLPEAAKQGLGPLFPLVVMIGTIFTISDLLGDPALGFHAFITHYLGPVLDVGNVLLFTVIILCITWVISLFLSSVLLRGILSPILVPLLIAFGIPIMPFMVVFQFVLFMPLWFPSAGGIAAIIHGFPHIGSNNVLKYMPIYQVVILIVGLLIGIPLSNFIFG